MRTLLALLALLIPNLASANALHGLWKTENERGIIEIYACANDSAQACGKIVWIIDGGLTKDENNKDPEMRSRPICNAEILTGMVQSNQDHKSWSDGKIYNLYKGKLYHANMTVFKEDKLRLRGYIGMPLLGKTQIWTRINEDSFKRCQPDLD